MQSALLREDILRFEDIPDDEALLDELITLVDEKLTPLDPGWPELSDISLPEPKPDKQASRKKVRKIVADVLFFGFLIFLIVGAFFISQGDKKPVFGYSLMNVLTWSMEPEIPQGALVIVKETDPNAIQIGDDITYMKDSETSVTHRVIGITENFGNTGERGFETQGIANDTPDFDIVPADNVAGVVKAHVPLLGSWLTWLRTNLLLTLGFTVGLVLLFILLKGALKKPPEEGPENPKQPKIRKRKAAA